MTDHPTTYPRTLPLGPCIPSTMTVGADGITRLAHDIARMVAARAARDGITPRDAYRAIVANAVVPVVGPDRRTTAPRPMAARMTDAPTYDYDTDTYRADDDTPTYAPAPATREHIHGGRRCHCDYPGTTDPR